MLANDRLAEKSRKESGNLLELSFVSEASQRGVDEVIFDPLKRI
jgi:hypothetical protein